MQPSSKKTGKAKQKRTVASAIVAIALTVGGVGAMAMSSSHAATGWGNRTAPSGVNGMGWGNGGPQR